MHDMDRWRGKVALVTGASAGIGRAVSLDLARAGMRVALLARRAGRLDAVRSEIEAGGGEALCVVADLRVEADILAAFEAVRARFGGVDVLVNDAGIGRLAPLMTGATSDFRALLELNVLAVAICTREALADMRRRGAAGHVVHIASMSAHRVQLGNGMYAATKHAVRALTEGLRRELREAGSETRVSAVSPGDVETELKAVMYGSVEAARAKAPLYRPLDPRDVSAAVLHALSAPAHVEVHDILLRPTGQPD
ncbi:MAG: SDR family NAD(P)-dependent oxidoreductase [Deltaproteobacteria bacterium]|nr:SDR family NAD(P)-dependent oxidoreductase [Deltaproteobacteria bacterium]